MTAYTSSLVRAAHRPYRAGTCALLALALAATTVAAADAQAPEPELGSAIFIHPDGAGVAAWSALRLLSVGPDGETNWDRLERVGVYRGHMANSLGASSHGGATTHAYGVKVPYDSYGMRAGAPLVALSGRPLSIMAEARQAGLATALINSGHIAEPGTGVFAASAPSRSDAESITSQIIESGVDIILAGGEVLMRPVGVEGRHGQRGLRRDGADLVARAQALGYRVVFTRDELMALPDTTSRVLGLFAASHTFYDRPEELLAELGLPLYAPDAPTVEEMAEKALRILATRDQRFFMVVEEEGSDNFANHNNAVGTMTALARADAAIGVALEYAAIYTNTLVLTTADSDAGGLEVVPIRATGAGDRRLPDTMNNGAQLDGREGTGTRPFVARPDASGRRLAFGIAWAGQADVMGGIVARAHGLNAALLPASVDNTDIYRMLYATLFGRWLE